jgi:uncharacterized repeat protein (TIGR01451 family)
LATSTDTTCESTDSDRCTLRAAIQAADNAGGASTITLPAGEYKLTIKNPEASSEDEPSTGDLDINERVALTLTGAGAGSTTIDAGKVDRAFAVHFGASLSISGLTIQNGSSLFSTPPSSHSTEPGDGGAIWNAGSLTVTESELVSNSTNARGGAIYTTGDLTVTDSTFAANSADTIGGALVDEGSGLVKLVNDTIADNSSAEAAVAYATPGSMDAGAGSELLNVTIAGNSGVGIYQASLAVKIENTIVADNTGKQCEGGASSADAGGNIDSDGTCFVNGVDGDMAGIDPRLGGLADNGGPTATEPLLAGSPAIGRAIASGCPATDQRGVARLSSLCDSGAYQTIDADLALQGSGPTNARAGQQITDTFTISNSGPYAATEVTFTDSIPVGAGFTIEAIKGSQGDCPATEIFTGAGGNLIVTCQLGTLTASQTATVTISLTPSQAGALSSQASVSASSIDSDEANNSATVSTSVTGNLPVNTAPPLIAGPTSVGQTLTASTGIWTGNPTSYTYQWERCDEHAENCQPIPGATKSTYLLTSSDNDARIRVMVTATNGYGSTSATSLATEGVEGSEIQISVPRADGTTATLSVSCGDKLACSLEITLLVLFSGGHIASVGNYSAVHHAKVIDVGRAKVSIPAGDTKKVRVKLNSTGRRLLAKYHKLKVKVEIRQGGHTVRTLTITFKAKKPDKSKHH